MKDAIVFLTAYEATEYKRSFQISLTRKKSNELLEKYHIKQVFSENNLLTPKGSLTLDLTHDYVSQRTNYKFHPINKKNKLSDYTDCLKCAQFYINLLHAQSILSDTRFFKIKTFISLESFIVYINDEAYQIDAEVFSIDNTLVIACEVISVKTGLPLTKDDVCGKTGNFNILHIKGFHHFGDTFSTLAESTIPELIYKQVNDFEFDCTRHRFRIVDYAYIHSTLVLSNQIADISEYICKLVSVKELQTPLENISTTDNYSFYVQDGSSVVTGFDAADTATPLFNGILLESIKLYIFLSQIINTEVASALNKVTRNDLYIESLFFVPHVPIETSNFLRSVYKTSSFQNRKEASKLKLAYMNADNATKKNRNSVLLNILLYIFSLLGAINTLETLELKLGIPFKTSFIAVIVFFIIFGLIWVAIEYKRNKRF